MRVNQVLLLLVSVILFILSGCTKTKEEIPNVIADKNFERGFNLTNTTTFNRYTIPIDYLGKVDPLVDPLWELAQWGVLDEGVRPNYVKDDHDLQKGTETQEGDSYLYKTKSESKVVKVNPTTGMIELNVNSQKEYGNIPRQNNEDWPHLLLQQNLSQNYFLKDLKSIVVEIEIELTEYERFASGGTAQFQWIFNIADTNPNSPGYRTKDYYWFNITYFDARDYENHQVAGGGALIDSGKADATKKFIYQADAKKFMENRLEIGKKVRLTFDFLPMMKEAFELAKSNDYNCLVNSTYEDMALNNFNIGWEVPGIYHVGIKITDIVLRLEEK